MTCIFIHNNYICGVMVSVLASSVLDRRFQLRLGQTKDFKIGICCFFTKEKEQTGWLGIRIMCPSGAICISADCCFSELALLKIKLSMLV